LTASAVSTIDVSSGVLTADAQRQATQAVPGTVATLKPHKLWTSPFAANTRKENTRQLHSTYLVLASSLAFDVIEFYRKLVAASKPSEIDLIPFESFDPSCTLWLSERWRRAHDQYSGSAPATVRALQTLIPADWGTQTDEEIMETLYTEDEAISDFH
jgi:hypothetical protein